MLQCHRLTIVGLAAAIVAAATCTQSGGAPPAGEGPLEPWLKIAAKDYANWGPVDDRAHWSTAMCAPPKKARPLKLLSEIDRPNFGFEDLDADDHGPPPFQLHAGYQRATQTLPGTPGTIIFESPQPQWSPTTDKPIPADRLYSLFAKDRKAYLRAAKQSNPVGQMVVKEVYSTKVVGANAQPMEITGHVTTFAHDEPNNRLFPYLESNGRLLKADKQAHLLVMVKLHPKTLDTDEGWVYGVLTPAVKRVVRIQNLGPTDPQAPTLDLTLEPRVTSADKLTTCTDCHKKAANDRLFGLPAAVK